MKIKFIIAKASNTHSFWKYYKIPKSTTLITWPGQPPTYRENKIADGFYLTNIAEAFQFETYEQAKAKIEEFDSTVEVKKTETGYEHIFIGAGIYKIDKIFINEVPSTTVVAL